ncbi:DUF255 domain-containing protein [Sulfurimonas sp. HSL3-2]|uniref:thioredoxin family protein n=1 Tax=Hydrocurvibacter mobilis TaxID=3131936 RepID=UPI0031F9D737
MKKILLSLILLISALSAAELHVANSFKDSVAKAENSEKPILFIVSRHTCRYCVILEKNTLSNAQVIDRLNKDFITYIAYTDDGDMFPDEYWRPGTPAIWFLDDQGRAISEPLMGAIDAANLLKVLDIVDKRFKKQKKMDKYNYTRSKL